MIDTSMYSRNPVVANPDEAFRSFNDQRERAATLAEMGQMRQARAFEIAKARREQAQAVRAQAAEGAARENMQRVDVATPEGRQAFHSNMSRAGFGDYSQQMVEGWNKREQEDRKAKNAELDYQDRLAHEILLARLPALKGMTPEQRQADLTSHYNARDLKTHAADFSGPIDDAMMRQFELSGMTPEQRYKLEAEEKATAKNADLSKRWGDTKKTLDIYQKVRNFRIKQDDFNEMNSQIPQDLQNYADAKEYMNNVKPELPPSQTGVNPTAQAGILERLADRMNSDPIIKSIQRREIFEETAKTAYNEYLNASGENKDEARRQADEQLLFSLAKIRDEGVVMPGEFDRETKGQGWITGAINAVTSGATSGLKLSDPQRKYIVSLMGKFKNNAATIAKPQYEYYKRQGGKYGDPDYVTGAWDRYFQEPANPDRAIITSNGNIRGDKVRIPTEADFSKMSDAQLDKFNRTGEW